MGSQSNQLNGEAPKPEHQVVLEQAEQALQGLVMAGIFRGVMNPVEAAANAYFTSLKVMAKVTVLAEMLATNMPMTREIMNLQFAASLMDVEQKLRQNLTQPTIITDPAGQG